MKPSPFSRMGWAFCERAPAEDIYDAFQRALGNVQVWLSFSNTRHGVLYMYRLMGARCERISQ